MPNLLASKSLYYDDINLIARPQMGLWSEDKISQSRETVRKELDRIIVSPMAAIVGEAFALEALNLGLTVCLPRLSKNKEFQKDFLLNNSGLSNNSLSRLYVSVGLNDYKSVEKLNHQNVLIDVANGYLSSVVFFQQQLVKRGFNVMCGNVHSAEGFGLYEPNTVVRVGIGQGSVCKTRFATGYTRGQVTEILDCYDAQSRHESLFKTQICADGGLKTSGDIVKAFALGANYVMIGGLLKNAKEAQNVIDGDYSYWGGASHKQQLITYGKIKRHSEGGEVSVDKENITSLKDIVNDIWGGISSGVSYSGFSSVSELIGNGTFEIIHQKQS